MLQCEKIYNLFVRALESDRKANLWRTVLSCFATSENEFDIFRQCTYIVFNVYNVKNPKPLPNCQ